MKKQITMERVWPYPLRDVWELWTTPEGIESWWGPSGFTTRVSQLELKVGGSLVYSFTAVGAPQVAFMKRDGQPLTQTMRATYTTVEPMTEVAWSGLTEFITEVEPYAVETRVRLQETKAGVEMTLLFDVMHSPMWTDRATAGWKEELGKLGDALERRKAKR